MIHCSLIADVCDSVGPVLSSGKILYSLCLEITQRERERERERERKQVSLEHSQSKECLEKNRMCTTY